MKLKYCSILTVIILASCSRIIEVEMPVFDVTTTSTTFKAGEAINFTFTGGNVNNICFYSGETLKDYDFRDGRIVDVSDSTATVSFQSSVQNGTQANQVSVLASTDFNGDYSSLAKIKAATWTDITSWFKFGIDAKMVASGTKDIKSLVVPGKPIYFAFKYLTKPQATNGLVRTWYVELFNITSTKKLANGAALTLTDHASAGFRIIDENPATKVSPTFIPYDKAPAQSTTTTTRITLIGNRYLTPDLTIFDPLNPVFDPLNPIYNKDSVQYQPAARLQVFVPYDAASPYNDPQSENWAVSKAISLDKVNLGPDLSVALKGVTTSPMTGYSYTYAKPGTYKAVFIASSSSIDQVKQVVKEITLTITQ